MKQRRFIVPATKASFHADDGEDGKHDKIRLGPYLFISLAGSMALIFVLYRLIFDATVVSAPKGQHLAHVLPDGSQVWLNADSELRYSSFTRESNRDVTMRGEVFFRIVKGGPFNIKGEYGTVTVRGASININQRNGLRVACFKGEVNVSDTHGNTLELKSGRYSIANDTTMMSGRMNAEKEASWLTGDFYFNNTPLEEVLDEIRRQFDVEVHYRDTTSKVYTGHFTNANLDIALRDILGSMSLQYNRDGDEVVIGNATEMKP